MSRSLAFKMLLAAAVSAAPGGRPEGPKPARRALSAAVATVVPSRPMLRLAAGLEARLAPASAPLFLDGFDGADGLVTNEYATYNAGAPGAVTSADWEVTSGSLFRSAGKGWTGVPDTRAPGADSSAGTNSAVFRAVTRRSDFGDVAVEFELLNGGLTATASTPAVAWDGCHVFLRYRSAQSLYYASINRRDNKVILKKKVPGGPSNGGTYYDLGTSRPYAVPYGQWQSVRATVRNGADGSVTIGLYAGGTLLVSATDRGVGGPPIREAGRVGIRGDNADLRFEGFTVSELSPEAAQPAPGPAPEPPGPPEVAAAGARAPQRLLSPALADGVNDAAVFGPTALEVEVFDASGRRVFGARRQGAAPLLWPGRDSGGTVVPSGVYIARIVTTGGRRVYQSFAVAR